MKIPRYLKKWRQFSFFVKIEKHSLALSSKMSENKKQKQRISFKKKVLPMLSKMGSRILQEKFFNAVYSRNVPEIKHCIEKGVDPNMADRFYGVAPLHLLAERNDYLIAFHLLESQDVNLNIKSVHGYTALHVASTYNNLKFVNTMLRNGADPNMPDRCGKTALHWAVLMEHPRIIKTLIKNGAFIEVTDSFENTPLSLSILDVRNIEIAKLLVKGGINNSFENSRNLHVLFETILDCHTLEQIDFVVLILDHGVNINIRDPTSGGTCLHFVAITGYLELAVVLMERGARNHLLDVMRRTAVKVAYEHGNTILGDYLRKGYKPPDVLATLPLIYLWSNKIKNRLAANRTE